MSIKHIVAVVALCGAAAGCGGSKGEMGPAGLAGTACTAVDASGVKTITCTDGTKITLNDGKAGVDGLAGKDGKDGANGLDGAAGTDGANGTDGAPGKDGADGTPCTVTDNGDGSVTIACGDTQVTVYSGKDGVAGADGASCEVKDNGDGTKTVTCNGTEVIVTDGTDGQPGTNGADALPCTVKDNGNGTKTITCPDGTTVTVANGTNGAAGATGGNVLVTDFHGTDHLLSSGAFENGAKSYVKATITSATADVDGKVTVNYKVEDAAKKPVTTLTAVSANIVKLMPPAAGESFTKWVPYIYNKATVSNSAMYNWAGKDGDFAWQGSSESANADPTKGGKLTNHGDGSYTYEFKNNVATAKGNDGATLVGYDRAVTHRIAIMMGGGTGPTADAWFDFVPDGSAAAAPRDVIRTETCYQCHGETQFRAHGGNRLHVEVCVTCHNPYTVDPNSKNTVDMKVMIHKIHAGAEVASIKGADGIVFDDPKTAADESADNGKYEIYGYKNNHFTWWKVGFPAMPSNCTKCHQGSAAQVDNWKTTPSRAACGSCHDTVDFATGANHPGQKQLNDNACGVCHDSAKVIEYHDWTTKDERNIPEFDAVVTVSTPANGTHFVAGEAPVVSIVLKKDGAPIDHTTIVQDDKAEGCKADAACPNADGKFTAAEVFVHGPRARRVPVLTTAARAKVVASGPGPFDLSAAGASLVLKVDGGKDLVAYNVTGGDSIVPGTFTVTVPATGAFADKAAATTAELVAWLNADAKFKARAIAYTQKDASDADVLVIRSRNKGSVYSVQLQTSAVATAVFPASELVNGAWVVHTSGGYYPSNKLAKQPKVTDDDPKATRTVDKITYQLDPVDDLQPGTYITYVKFADRGRIDASDYKTPSVAMVTFQVGTATEEKPIARNCNSCHQTDDGKGFILDPSRHNKIFSDLAMDQCGACHDSMPQNAAGDWSGAKPIAKRVHAIHFGSSLNYPLQTVWYGNGDPVAGRNWDITLPQDVRNCETCHPKGTTSGTWATKPGKLACWGCHDSDAAQAHFKVMVADPTPADPYSGDEVESCGACHAP